MSAGTSESRRLFKLSMKLGYVDVDIMKMLFYGSAGVGKTCTQKIVTGEDPPAVRNSTPIATRPVTMYQMQATKETWQKYTSTERMKLCARISKSILGQELTEALVQSNPKNEATTAKSDESRKENAGKEDEIPDLVDSEQQPAKSTGQQHDEESGSKAPPSTTTKQNFVDPKVIKVIHDVLDKMFELIAECPDDKEPISYLRKVRIVDSGGQPQFHEVLPIFLRKMSMIVFVFKLSEDLSSRPKIEYFEEGSALGTPYESDLTTEQLIEDGLVSLHSHRSSKQKDHDSAQIALLGTHKDKEKNSNETREAKNQRLREILLPTFEKELVYYQPGTNEVIFPMNAKCPGKEEEDIAEALHSVVSNRCPSHKKRLPQQWMALEIVLEEITSILQRGIMTLHECEEVARKLHIDESMLEAALTYLDELSLLFYFPVILPNLVFTNPQVILDKISELVKIHHNKTMKCSIAGSEAWHKFFNHALVTVQFLAEEVFQKHYVPGLFGPEDLVILYRKLYIFADHSDGHFFVPSLLQMLSSDSIAKYCQTVESPIAPLVLIFSDGPPHRGIFCALVSFLTSPENHFPGPWKLKMPARSVIPTCLYRNCIQFTIPCAKTPCTVTLVDTLHHFEVHPKVTSKQAAAELCPTIKEAVSDGILKATIALNYTHSSPDLAFLCPCGAEDPHHATIGDGFWICSLDQGNGEEFSENQLIWLQDVSSTVDQLGKSFAT